MTQINKIDSNSTGLRYAVEDSYKTVSGNEIWYPMEPNSYNDFGGQVTTVARNPINSGRQRKKGVVTDLDASGGINTDITQTNLQDMLQGFMFANFRRRQDVGANRSAQGSGLLGVDEDFLITDIDTTTDEITVDSRVGVTAAVVVGGTGYAVGDTFSVTDVNATILSTWTVATVSGGVVLTVSLLTQGRTHTDTGAGAATVALTGSGDDALTVTITYGNGLTWLAGDLLFLAGNNDAANNGLKTASSITNNVITTVENLTTDASPASTATMTTVGHQFAADDLNVVTGTLPTITSDAAFDFTTLPLLPGEPFYIGADVAGDGFATAANNGWKRCRATSATALTIDKSVSTMVTESLAGGETVQIFYGRPLKNEDDQASQVRRTYQLERSLGAPDDVLTSEIQAEYITGAVPSEFTLNVPTADKATVDLSFVGADNETITGPAALKAGTRPALVEADAYNTSSDVPLIKMAVASSSDESPTALFAFVTDLTLAINNNVSANKAVGTLGAFEVTAGTFAVSGELTAYFGNVSAIQAVRDNSDITLALALVKDNVGIAIDLPLLTLGDGRPNVEQDAAITLPITSEASTGAKVNSALNHTLFLSFFDYLPTVAG
jgi:hypothetical protein